LKRLVGGLRGPFEVLSFVLQFKTRRAMRAVPRASTGEFIQNLCGAHDGLITINSGRFRQAAIGRPKMDLILEYLWLIPVFPLLAAAMGASLRDGTAISRPTPLSAR